MQTVGRWTSRICYVRSDLLDEDMDFMLIVKLSYKNRYCLWVYTNGTNLSDVNSDVPRRHALIHLHEYSCVIRRRWLLLQSWPVSRCSGTSTFSQDISDTSDASSEALA